MENFLSKSGIKQRGKNNVEQTKTNRGKINMEWREYMGVLFSGKEIT